MNSNENTINSVLAVSWSTAHDLREPPYWSGVMSEIDGIQRTFIHVDIDNDELLDDLQFLWAVALKRRSMAYEAQA